MVSNLIIIILYYIDNRGKTLSNFVFPGFLIFSHKLIIGNYVYFNLNLAVSFRLVMGFLYAICPLNYLIDCVFTYQLIKLQYIKNKDDEGSKYIWWN